MKIFERKGVRFANIYMEGVMSFRTGEVPCVIKLCKSSGAPYGGRRFLVLFLLQSGLKKIVRDALHAWIRAVGAAVVAPREHGRVGASPW